MKGFESDYLSEVERGTEQREGERSIEQLSYTNTKAVNNNEEFNIQESTISSLNILSDLMELGEDIEEVIKDILRNRKEVIIKLKQEGKLDDLSEKMKNIIEKYIEKSINIDEER